MAKTQKSIIGYTYVKDLRKIICRGDLDWMMSTIYVRRDGFKSRSKIRVTFEIIEEGKSNG